MKEKKKKKRKEKKRISEDDREVAGHTTGLRNRRNKSGNFSASLANFQAACMRTAQPS